MRLQLDLLLLLLPPLQTATAATTPKPTLNKEDARDPGDGNGEDAEEDAHMDSNKQEVAAGLHRIDH